ncbi:N(5)-(carboxyethyl)ornithine synthase [Vagococcus lutrae]|uniref:N(5)-(carboxyethyl)ornithine synthase n=1 Tax=Vagococcus lutrae TaxID=81947 RepID=UPI0020105CEE|nr:N(5)-(carboxyethyl)ornithine synthase [Vagococcus lutrae]UQF24035.1 N(5)-(carboxyethyl)ornithine synthase [Vagococcus lutrae]UQF63874.1 N(5)-(carboxyethyl)ornithine synthase [Vagococcus lutrae]
MKKKIGFLISDKENEHRRAILPKDIKNISNRSYMYFEKGYGSVLGISDNEYVKSGANVCSRETIMTLDVICDPKIGDANYINELADYSTLFGWIHAVQNKPLTDLLINKKMTVYAWEDMNYLGRHVFWKNNEIAGEAAVLHAYQTIGKMPYSDKVAIIGRGNTARGAYKILSKLGAEIDQYDRKTERFLKENLNRYDAIINCVLWDLERKDHIIYEKDLKKLKKGAIIIDVSCDKEGAIETSVPTTIEKPIYIIDNVIHYVVDHTPSIYYKTFTDQTSPVVSKYIDYLINGENDEVLRDARIINEGEISDNKIIEYQNRDGKI